MNTPADIPAFPHAPHTIQWARYARELLALSGVPTHEDELWNRLDHASTQIESRLTVKPPQRGKRFILTHCPVRRIEALAEHFSYTRQAIVRQFIRQCPVESFPEGWVADDTRITGERLAHQEEAP